MARFETRVIFLLMAVALPEAIQAATGLADFSYIGTATSNTGVRRSGGGGITTAASDYYLSHNNAEWETADQDCKDVFGEDSSLVSIETKDELSYLVRFIERTGNAATLYLTGGKYETATRKWKWTNGAELGTWAPWENGRPGLASRMSRVALRLANGAEFRSQFNTVAARYICEVNWAL